MKRYLVLVSLLMLFGVASALAAVAPTYTVTTTPTFVINTGRSEALGSVRLTVTAGSLDTYGSSIEYNFKNIACDLTLALPIAGVATSVTNYGPQLIYGGSTGTAILGANLTAIINKSTGCTVAVTIPAGMTANVGDYLELQGVRGRVDLSPGLVEATNLTAFMSSTPSTSALFTVPNEGVIAISARPLDLVKVDPVGKALFCGVPTVPPKFEFKEHFNGAFAFYKDATGSGGYAFPPTNPRPLFGAINNTQVHFVVTGLPAGAKLTWPAVSSIQTLVVSGTSQFTKLSQSTTGDTATYEYSTTDQGNSDITLEDFTIEAALTPGTHAGSGTIQIQMYPPLESTDTSAATQVPYTATTVDSPRFNDPLQPTPAATALTVGPCKTNLLFPWVANVSGYDTGLAIANTSTDPFDTDPQSGSCVINGYPKGGTAVTPLQTAVVESGDTFTMVMSSATNPAFNGWAGYVIAACNFQYGHGFAYIVDNYGVGAPTTAQGYVALVIPDPDVNGKRLVRDSAAGDDNSGESLAQ